MARIILDSGALMKVEEGDKRVAGWLKEAFNQGPPPIVPTAVIAESWRGGKRSARVGQMLKACRKEPLSDDIARRAGELLGHHQDLPRAREKSRVVDAIVVITASLMGDTILTSDVPDITALANGFPNLRIERV